MDNSTTRRARVRKRKRRTVPLADQKLELEYLRPSQLHLYQRNPRKHSPEQIAQLKSSIQAFGFINPIIVDANNCVVAGHGRLQAVRELGGNYVPVIRAEHLTDEQIKAYRIADNKLAENSDWDLGRLRIELEDLADLEQNGVLSFDLSAVGFETAELDILLQEDSEDPTEHLAEPDAGEPVAKLGDLWQVGRHQVYCGSSLEAASCELVSAPGAARMVLTDPPYDVPINGHVRTGGKRAHREFAMASGEMGSDAFTRFLTTALTNAKTCSAPGAVIMCFMDWRHTSELGAAARASDLEQINLAVWVKSNAGMGSFYRSQHELCFIFRASGGTHTNNVQLGRYGRNRTNVWRYPGVNSFGPNRAADLADHPTVKPVAMLEDAIRDATDRGDLVLDLFGGSGSTLLAAERTGRRARLIEIDPAYVDVTIRRWQLLTGEEAVLVGTGQTWNSLAASTSSEEEDHD